MKIALVLLLLVGARALASSEEIDQEISAFPSVEINQEIHPVIPDTTEANLAPDAPIEPDFILREPVQMPPRPTHELEADVEQSDSQTMYFTPFRDGHSECEIVSTTLMKCPTNQLNEKLASETQQEFIDREIAFELRHSDDYIGCREQNPNIILCPTTRPQ